MLVLQLLTQKEGVGSVTRKLAFGEVMVTYVDNNRDKPKQLILGSPDSWQLFMTESSAVLTPPLPQDEVVAVEDRDIVISPEINVEVNVNLDEQEESEVIPEREDTGLIIGKELEEVTTDDEEVLAVVINSTQYPVTAFEEIVHKLLK